MADFLARARTLFEGAAPPVPPTGGPRTWSRAQLLDLQGSAMLWCPELKPTYVNGVDPKTGIREVGDNGGRPHGIAAGWIWLPWIWFYPKADRLVMYAAMQRQKWTHAIIAVAGESVGNLGYHGLRPVGAEDVARQASTLNDVMDELEAVGILPVAMGVSPTDPVAPGFDTARVKVAISDWDNSTEADCRIKALSETFPNALLIYELPAHALFPTSGGCGAPVDPNAGGAWIRKMQQLYPRFVGVMLELNIPEDGVEACAAEVRKLWPFWRDVVIYAIGETDWYWEFWDNRSFEQSVRDNDALYAALADVVDRGWLSVRTPHAPPADDTGPIDITTELDLHEATIYEMPGDVADWPITTKLTKIDVRDDDVYLEFDARDRWPDVLAFPPDGLIQFSLGMALKIGGKWYASAPIEVWRGKPGSGGGIFKPGQIPNNWFYDGRWGSMKGYQPKSGEQIGIFVVAGDMRNKVYGVRERSNVVLITVP